MTIRFVIGRAGSGKSELCLEEIRQRLREQPDGSPLILLVPEQATFLAEHALVSMPGLGGMIRAQVLSFHRLAWRIMQEQGGTARMPIDDTGKKLLLHRLIHNRKEELRLFRASAEQMGFVDRLVQLFTEFKRYCVTADRLDEHESKRIRGIGGPGLLRDKLHDVKLLYRDYETELKRLYLDGEDYLSLLAQQLPFSDSLKNASLWIDGFHGFTPQEFSVVEKLVEHTADVTITLCLDRGYEAGEQPHELDLFYPTARTMIELQERLQKLGAKPALTTLLSPEVAPRFLKSPMLGHLERFFDQRIGSGQYRFKPSESMQQGPEEQIVIREAVNRRAEVEGMARDMLKLVRDSHVRWRHIAVMVRNMEGYQDMLHTVLTDYGIPHFFDQKRTVLHHPLVEFVRSALEVVLHNWHYDAVFRCVKTDLLLPTGEHPGDANEISMLRAEMDRLENYVLAFGIQGYRFTDGKPWTYKLKANLESAPEEQSEQEASELHAINRSRERVVKPLLAFEKRIKQAQSVKKRAEALYELLQDVQAPQKLELWSEAAKRAGKPEKAREHMQLWGGLMDMLDQLVEAMGDEEVSDELFAGLIETGLESMKMGLVPPSMDQVLIGSMDRTRSSNIHYAYILGVNDGVIPAQLKEDGILTESERELLLDSGLPMADGSRRRLLDEQFLVYTGLAVPGRRLWLSYPLADEEGKSLLPSELIKQIAGLFPDIRTRQLLAEPNLAMEETEQAAFIANPEQTLAYLGVQLKAWMRGNKIQELWWDVYNWYAQRPARRFKLQNVVQALLYTNREGRLSLPTSQLLYGKHLRASVSRMERYVTCPFSHFLSHGLRLKERRVYRLEAPDIGQLFHAALSQFAEQLRQEQVDWGALSAEEIYERSSAVVDRLAPRLQGEILLSSNRYHYIARKLKEVVGRASAVLGEHARHGQFTPLRLELDFGPGKELPPLTFQLDNGCTMEIIGRIDRVDCADSDKGLLLRVIDYKSSQTSLNLSEVYYGLSLQVLTYLDVLITHAGQWLGAEALPAGVLYFHVHNPMLQLKNGLDPAEVAKELRKRFKMKGLVTADADVVHLMDESLKQASGHSQLIPVAVTKEGGFYKSSSVATEAQWNLLRGYVRRQIRKIGTGITEGHVDIAPYRMGKKAACQHCSYKAVCQFDPLFEGNEFQVWRHRAKELIWTELEGLTQVES